MLSPTQREILEALIELYEKKKETVKGEDISAMLHRTPGTIRNQMQTLKAMGYVDGVPGPKGGYIPAMKAFEALDIEVLKKPHTVHIYRDGKPIEGINVQRIEFSSVANPDECMSLVTVMGDSRKIREHDIIKVGPTPVNHVILTGEVVGRDDIRRELRIASHSITSIPKGKVSEISAKELISFTPETKLRECAKILVEKQIRAAPVIKDGKLLGIITEGEIVKAVAAGDIEQKVGDLAIKNPYTIDPEARLIDSLEKMKKYGVGRLIVTKNEKPVGIITRTDILFRMME